MFAESLPTKCWHIWNHTISLSIFLTTREDIKNKMRVDIHIGAQESELGRVADLQWWPGLGLFQSMWPKGPSIYNIHYFWVFFRPPSPPISTFHVLLVHKFGVFFDTPSPQ